MAPTRVASVVVRVEMSVRMFRLDVPSGYFVWMFMATTRNSAQAHTDTPCVAEPVTVYVPRSYTASTSRSGGAGGWPIPKRACSQPRVPAGSAWMSSRIR